MQTKVRDNIMLLHAVVAMHMIHFIVYTYTSHLTCNNKMDINCGDLSPLEVNSVTEFV